MRAFRHQEFLPLSAVVDQKRRQGLSVSLVLPALNESATIGPIVDTACRGLRDREGLLDEVLVIDGGSSDATARIAAEAGATVHAAAQIAPDVAAPAGKGTSMWKALLVAGGDIVVFADADIREFGPHFVYGVAAPLVLYPELQWAKAVYRRPFQCGAMVLDDYGGRVTELLVRPLLSAWYPDLAGVRQPLSGEYAVRREALRGLRMSSGYGVEMLLLLQLYRAFGIGALAEVDMGERHHRNRSPRELGVMAYAILRAFFGVLREEGRVSGDTDIADRFVRPGVDGVEVVVVPERSLPPVGDIGAHPAGRA